jgi:hypothetical protein
MTTSAARAAGSTACDLPKEYTFGFACLARWVGHAHHRSTKAFTSECFHGSDAVIRRART